MPSVEPGSDTRVPRLDALDRATLLELARASIRHGLRAARPASLELSAQPAALRAVGAAFVTLLHADRLRGCIGSLEPCRPLALDVVENAFAAAFRDRRFEPVRAVDLARLRLDISVLTPAEPIACASERELRDALRPGIDGVILALGARRGTFLPAVWEQLPEPRDFVRHLKIKAGLDADFWSPELRAWRYRTDCFGAPWEPERA